jgi:hypothetical protein
MAQGSSTRAYIADDCFPITPNDGADLAVTVRGLIVATAGAVKITNAAGNTVTLTLPAGQFSLGIKRVWSSGTTATGLTGLV